MESVQEDGAWVNVKSLVSKFHDKDSAKKKGKGVKPPRSVHSKCLSVKTDHSIEAPLLFKGNEPRVNPSIHSGYATDVSDVSKDAPNNFNDTQVNVKSLVSKFHDQQRSEKSATSKEKGKRVKPPRSVHSKCLSVKTDHSIEAPLLFKGNEPRVNPSIHSGYATDVSDVSKDAPNNFNDTQVNVKSLVSKFHDQQRSEKSATLKEKGKRTERAYKAGLYSKDLLDNKLEEEVICDICCQDVAVKTCLTCNISYCEFDVRQHYKAHALQRHKLRDVCEEIEGKRCVHYQESLDFFCRTDQMQICSICTRRTHRDHDIISQRKHRAASQISGDEEYQDPGHPDTVVPPPGQIKFRSVKPNSVVVSWGCPKGLEGPKSFRVQWSSLTKVEGCIVINDFHEIEINDLQFGQKYSFGVVTEDEEGNLSEWVKASVFTAVPAPRHLTKGHSEATALSLKWTKGDNMEGIPHQFLITVTSPGKESLAIYTKSCYKILSDLVSDTEYHISVSTVLNGRCSEKISTTIRTEPCLRKVLSEIGFKDQYDNKLMLSTALEIDQNDMSENTLEKSLPGVFLKSLMMLDTNARSVKCMSQNVDMDERDAINPLDLITALFLCSDGFLQQDIVLKMALCQFAVPLLLPNHETREITMMLWSMREIVQSFRPSLQARRKLSCEERIVLSDIHLVSFVRLGRMTLSKSNMLNKLLSNSQQYHDIFYHRNMACGDVPRRISDGLVEISWYLPCGNRNIDKFTEPLAVANLRGDIKAFDKQFSFLCQTSEAVYILYDESEADYFKNLEGKDVKANVFLISSGRDNASALQTLTMQPCLKITNVSKKKNTDTELIKSLQESISKMLASCPNKVRLANLADRARCCEILVDEDSEECQSAWKNADKITKHIANTSEFKEQQLASQGHIWKGISWLETECWRLRKAGNQNTEDYRRYLKKKEKELRRKQLRFEVTAAMLSFLHGVVTSEMQRYYFLKWLEMDLDILSRTQLSALQDRYKEQSQKIPQDTGKIAEIDKQISVGSLRLWHFFRECGQLYECASYLPEYSHRRKNIEELPAVCAQKLLDGFPLELVDGDAANIPMKWITEVLTELHYIMQSSSKLKVLTIIGAENSGKSTLLNTMFGVRFAVSKGTCTRGAFIQLINVHKDVREELGCDCLLIIDTEGLKPNQMVQDDHSHERDKEVASLAVALSDVTIVSVSGDYSSKRDILEMVLHAFMRLKDEGAKPLCHFVHTNVSDLPAAESKRRDSKELVEQLNEIIQKDIRMNKANITKISDMMEFDSETCSWYIPPVWQGTPPMAPFSVKYIETAQALKKRLLVGLKKCQERGDLTDFIRRVESFWKAL
ncbi:hypothetical protein L3Q82_019361 [Scortum barcoo]|uniref:Uncharacterized protein n=1 Tax=Scortum barcoo TaxID=214431 RepID=A0ACB8VAW4_9TELE|nr:hypothetical protein L3Q82_019361 [Scortum barcoo]